MAKNNTPSLDFVILPAVGSSKGGKLGLTLSKFLRGDKRRKPAIGQAGHAPQCRVTPAAHPEVNFLGRSWINGDMLEVVVLAIVADVGLSPEPTQNSNAFIGHGT